MTFSVATSQKNIVGLLFRKVLLYNRSSDCHLSLCNIDRSNRVVYIRASLCLNTIRETAYFTVRGRIV